MERKTVKLRAPIQFGSETITELTFRPVTGKDLRSLRMRDDYPMEFALALAGKLAGQPDAVIDMLAGQDLEEVVAIASGFMSSSPATGKTP